MASPRRGLVHQFAPTRFGGGLTAFEHTPSTSIASPQNILIFIGGLFDGLMTVPYATSISDALPPSWSLAQVHLSSSYTGWGTSSLQKDVKELSKCVSYFRGIRSGKVVLMGHSTGCQDVMEYLTGPGHETRAPIDGGIIQAPASDREAMVMEIDPDLYQRNNSTAKSMVDIGKGDDVFQNGFFPCPVTATRWLALASPNHDGDDDYFSSDLKDEQLLKSFGSLPARSPLCILISGNDEYMPKTLEKERLLQRWVDIVKRGWGKVDEVHSGILDGASHNLAKDQSSVVNGLVERVVGFLDGLYTPSNP